MTDRSTVSFTPCEPLCGGQNQRSGKDKGGAKASQCLGRELSWRVRAVACFLEPEVWSACLSLVCSAGAESGWMAGPRSNPEGRAG